MLNHDFTEKKSLFFSKKKFVQRVLLEKKIDDTFCLFHNEEDALMFFDYINARHPNIRFTMEREINKKLSFLDILLDNSHPSIVTSVYCKNSFTCLLTNYFSFAALNYKLGLVRTLLNRVYKINNSWAGFHLYVKKLIFLLRKNCSPSWGIDKIIRRYLSKKMNRSETEQNASSNSGKTSTHFYELKSLMLAGFLKSPRLSLDN